MADLDPARREELAATIRQADHRAGSQVTWETAMAGYADAAAPLIARWLAEARAEGAAEAVRPGAMRDIALARLWTEVRAEGAAEVRARVEAAVAMSDHEPTNRVWHEQMQRIRAALADAEGAAEGCCPYDESCRPGAPCRHHGGIPAEYERGAAEVRARVEGLAESLIAQQDTRIECAVAGRQILAALADPTEETP